MPDQTPQRRHPAWAGAAAGVATVLWFTILHQVLISNIWFSFVPMVLAGAACGSCLAWTYDLLFRPASSGTWVGFVFFQTCMLLLLGALSVAVFDPVVPMAVLIAANEPPTDLINQAMPLTMVFVVGVAVVTSLLWGRTLPKFGSSLLTSAVLVLFLGLNVSVLGLVEMSGHSTFLIAQFLGLIVAIMVGYGVAFFAMERRTLFQR